MKLVCFSVSQKHENLWRGVIVQISGLALLAGISIEAEKTLFQRHLQLLFVGMRVAFRTDGQLFLQNSNLHQKHRETLESSTL